jgi:hypothetical protein
MLVILLLGLIGFGLLKFSSGTATPGETIDSSTPVLVPVNPEK